MLFLIMNFWGELQVKVTFSNSTLRDDVRPLKDLVRFSDITESDQFKE